MTFTKFRAIVWRYYRAHGRYDLPWRKTRDLYKILVSEVMLQQTQVERVIPLYKNFLKRFPTVKTLARSSLTEVLESWQGLGYNRRAALLHKASKILAETARLKLDILSLEMLPGIGSYTARAIMAFAFNEDVIVIETNIRTAVIHHFFPKKKKVSDREIERILKRVLPSGNAREWYSALMDYGAYLKRTGSSHNKRSATYTRQSRFTGSLREARGALVRALVRAPMSRAYAQGILGADRREQMAEALKALRHEGLVHVSGGKYRLAD